LVPTVVGKLHAVSVFTNKTTTKPTCYFYVLDPLYGELTQYKTKKDYELKKIQTAAVFNLNQVMAVWGLVVRDELKDNQLNSIEINFFNDSLLLLALFDAEHISRWLKYL
jgi:hypothetical protein